MQYSFFAHGTSLHIESPAALASSTVVGWGTVLRFKPPVAQQIRDLTVYDKVGLGNWCHISIPLHANQAPMNFQLLGPTMPSGTSSFAS